MEKIRFISKKQNSLYDLNENLRRLLLSPLGTCNFFTGLSYFGRVSKRYVFILGVTNICRIVNHTMFLKCKDEESGRDLVVSPFRPLINMDVNMLILI